jgi:hypothetical protein
MILTEEEYRRGILSWRDGSGFYMRTSTTSSKDDEKVWSEPLSNPAGSKVESQIADFHHVRPETETLESPSAEYWPVFWERLNPIDTVQTEVWDVNNGKRVHFHLGEVPQFGNFHRLVIEASLHLTWSEDAVVHIGQSRIRLITGKVEGQVIPPFDGIATENATIILTRSATESHGGAKVTIGAEEGNQIKAALVEGDTSFASERYGRFLEIVARGSSPAEAESNAFSILGLLVLCWGDQASGAVVFSNTFHAGKDQRQEGIDHVPISGLIPHIIGNDELNTVDAALTHVFDDSPLQRACRLALRWYEKGIRSTANLDQFISFFVGIEAILNEYVETHGPIPEIKARKEQEGRKIKKLLKNQIDEKIYNELLLSLTYVSNQDRMKFYVKRENLPESLCSEFKDLAKLRADVFHSRIADVDDEKVMLSKTLLVDMLRGVLNISSSTPWQKLPQIGYLTRRYYYSDMGCSETTE